MMLVTMPTRKVNRTKYQNSERRARPEKPTYLEKQVRTAVMKSIETPVACGRCRRSDRHRCRT